jgi:hypothetical protein
MKIDCDGYNDGIRENGVGRAHGTHVIEEECMHTSLHGKIAQKRPCGRPRCRWDDNIKICIKETI